MSRSLSGVPYGEVFVEERNNSWSTPYKFNGKELDEETGLYYYGARYYDPKTSVWVSVDPLAEKYEGFSSYNYCFGNPIVLKEQNGKEPIGAFVDAAVAFGVDATMSYLTNVFKGQDARSAFDNIDWQSASIEGVKSYGMSLFIDGVGSAKAMQRIMKSPFGKLGVDVIGNFMTSLTKMYYAGEFNGDDGNFSIEKFRSQSSQIMGEFENSLISALISNGFDKVADKLISNIGKVESRLAREELKMQRKIQSHASDKSIKHQQKSIDNAQKKLVALTGKLAIVKATSKALENRVSNANNQRRKK